MNIFEFIVILITFITVVCLTFIVGVCAGKYNSDNVTEQTVHKKKRRSKKSDIRKEDNYKSGLEKLLCDVENYDGKPPVIRSE